MFILTAYIFLILQIANASSLLIVSAFSHLVKKYDGTIVTELPVIIDDDGQFAYSGKDSAIRQLIRDVYGTSYIEEKSKEGEDVYTYDAETVMKRLMKVSYNFTTRWENAETISKEDAFNL